MFHRCVSVAGTWGNSSFRPWVCRNCIVVPSAWDPDLTVVFGPCTNLQLQPGSRQLHCHPRLNHQGGFPIFALCQAVYSHPSVFTRAPFFFSVRYDQVCLLELFCKDWGIDCHLTQSRSNSKILSPPSLREKHLFLHGQRNQLMSDKSFRSGQHHGILLPK